ncbi:MAG TPA: ABC transporter permease [Opitutaceae bacterium]|nr:ABC transporter permease [Opitutaceae bacterium]
MLSDLRFVLRTLARSRVFTAVTVLTLALGIGSAAAIFSVTEWVLFRANPFPEDIYLVGGQSELLPMMPVRYPFMVRAYRDQTNVMAEWAQATGRAGNVVLDGRPVAPNWVGASDNLFAFLGVKPVLGRGFLPGEDVPGADQVVVIGDAFWKRHFGGRDDALGRTIIVGDAVCTVVGVLGANQPMPLYASGEIYRPQEFREDPVQLWTSFCFLLGRLRPGVTREQAAAVLAAVKPEVPAAMAQFGFADRAMLSSLGELNQLRRPEIHWMMLGAVAFLYAIACLNASNLLLVRMLGKRRELSVRLALGGGRWRVVRLLALEGAVLALLAAALGALVANWVFPLLLSAAGNEMFTTDWSQWSLSWQSLAVLGALSVATCVAIVILPAARLWRADISSGLKDGGAALGESPALARLRGAFVVLQAAAAVILLAGAGLMIRTFQRLENVDLGFEPDRCAKVTIDFPPAYHVGSERRLARLHEIEAELRRVPGVRGVGFGHDVVLPGFYFATHSVEGPGGQPVKAALLSFSGEFGKAAGLKLKRGRWLERPNGNEVLVNEALARACWPDRDPVGQLLRTIGDSAAANAQWQGWEVVGVVQDVRASIREAARPSIYGPEGWGPENFHMFMVGLSRPYDEAFGAAVRQRLFAFDPQLVVQNVQSVAAARYNFLWPERMANSVLEVLGAMALLLTVVGVFSVLAYTVDRRMGEFGVRMALGATRGNLVGLVLRRGVLLTLLGVVLGLGGAAALTRFLQSLLFETSPQEPWVLAGVAAVLLLASLLACALPARRAARVEVAQLLRSE